MPASEPPAAVTARCPECGKDRLHTVLNGTMKTRGMTITIDATVQCTACSHTHHALIKEARDVEVPVVISQGGTSSRSRVSIPANEPLKEGDTLIVDGIDCRVSGIESKDGKRVEGALGSEILTLWTKRFDMVDVGFAINLDKKTITKSMNVEPSRVFTIGEEFVFGRLRVTVHGIKTTEKMLKRGSVDAGDIVRIFAKPTPLARQAHRPDKRTREQLRDKEERKARRGPR